MIHFFATQNHCYTIRDFVDSWAQELRGQICIVPYEKLSFRQPFANGVCIFTDLERLLPPEMFLARKLAENLRAFPKNYFVLNDPRHCIGRLRLLQVLHERGINEFRACRVDEIDESLRFPVFLRSDLDHLASLTPLLHSRGELRHALAQLPSHRHMRRKRLMVVEYCDCADAGGIFRKFSAMNINGTLIPRHVLFSKNWMTKTPDIINESTVAEETDFVGNFQDADQLREIFQIAGVNYGRIDYGVRDGRVQVWEINTNPIIVPVREKIDSLRLAVQSRSARQILETLQKLSAMREDGTAFPFRSQNMIAGKAIQLFSHVICRNRP